MAHHDAGGLDAILREADVYAPRNADANDQVFGELDELRVTGCNADGSVKVRLNAEGALCDLQLTDEALQKSGAQLRDEIMHGIAAAQQDLSVKADADLGRQADHTQ